MSLSSDSVALRRKRTATERALNNANPLVIKKKACQAGVTVAKSNPPNNGPSMTNLGRCASVQMQGDNPSEVEPIAPTKSGMTSSDTQANTVQMSAPSQNKAHRRIHMEEVDDEDNNLPTYPRNPLHSSVSHILELSDGTDDDCPSLIVIEDKEDSDDEGDVPEESADAELERLSKDWNSPVYVFFKQTLSIAYIKGCCVHEFECAATRCMGKGNGRIVHRYLDTGDAKSTGNLHKHAKVCWGKDAVAAADETRNVQGAREALGKMRSMNSSITNTFERVAKGKVTYSHTQHTTTEAHAEIVCWVAESKRPFQIVNDRGFQSLMKTGHPVRKRIAKMLKKYDGALNFVTDAWTSPNHRAYVAIMVHFEHEGVPISMLLDLVKMAQSHSGVNLAEVFAKILEDFGIEDKILGITCDNTSNNNTMV